MSAFCCINKLLRVRGPTKNAATAIPPPIASAEAMIWYVVCVVMRMLRCLQQVECDKSDRFAVRSSASKESCPGFHPSSAEPLSMHGPLALSSLPYTGYRNVAALDQSATKIYER
jgi:hypothetical protein